MFLHRHHPGHSHQLYHSLLQSPDSGIVTTPLGPELTQLYEDPIPPGPSTNNQVFQVIDAGSVLIDVIANVGQYNALLPLLQSPDYGMTNLIDNGDSTLIITGLYPVANLRKLDSIPALVNFARPKYAPVNSAGLILSQGDRAMKSDSTRKLFRLDGRRHSCGCDLRQLQHPSR